MNAERAGFLLHELPRPCSQRRPCLHRLLLHQHGSIWLSQREAAQIAVRTATEWLGSRGSEMRVVFNVFSETDERIYRKLLGLQS